MALSMAGLSRFFPSPTAPKLRTLKVVLSSGEAIAGRRKQKEMKMAKVRVFIFQFWPILSTLATIGAGDCTPCHSMPADRLSALLCQAPPEFRAGLHHVRCV